MKTLLPLIGTLLMVSSCVDYDGSFRANEKLKFKHSTVFGNSKTKTLKAGRYNTSFEVTSGKKIKFTFRGEDTLEVKVDIPDHIDLPTTDGSFYYMAEETGQNYDIKGSLSTEYTSSGIQTGVESCSYNIVERQCRRVCNEAPAPRVNTPVRTNPNVRNPRVPVRPVPPRVTCRNVCNNVSVVRYGHQNVRYRINYTEKTLDLKMEKPNGGNQVANYRGLDKKSSRSYEYRSTCR